MGILLPALLGIALASEAEEPVMSEADAAALANSTECVAAIEAFGPCLRVGIVEDAEGFLYGRKKTLAGGLVGDGVPEFRLLRGIRLPTQAPEADECAGRLKKTFEVDQRAGRCFVAAALADLKRWTRHEKSQFGDAVAAEIARFRAYRSESGFQSTRWGMTPAEVSKLYPKATRQPNGDLVANMPVADYPAKVRFGFIDGRLSSVVVAFDVDHTRPDQDVRKTLDLRRLLTSKYGDPEVEDGSPSGAEVPIEALMREIGGAGRSVRAGRMLMRATWSPDEMEIELSLGSAIGEYAHHMVYRSDVFVERADAAREAARASEL